MREATVEIDLVQGCEFPPEAVSHGGKECSLSSIYSDAGIELNVVRGQRDIEDRGAGKPFDLIALHEYMVKHREERRIGWYAHILVVPQIQYMYDFRLKEPLGVMYDFRDYGVNTLQREGCAMTYDRVQQSDKMYLRTLAHELGHVFNLVHPNQDVPRQPYGTTIMNQTGMLQRQGDFPSNIRYEFSEADKRFLSTAPASFVQPGGVPFGRRPQRVGEMATDEEIPVTAGLSFTISTAVESYQIGEPVWLRMSLRNDSDAPVEVDANFSGATGLVDIAIRDPLNQETIFRPCYFECIEADVIELKPGEEVLGNLAVFFGADGYSFPIDGAYQLSATYQASIDGENVVTALSNIHEFEVKESQSSADIDYSDALMISPTQALFMILGGGSHLEGAVDSLTNIVRKYGDSRSAQFARLSLAQNTLREAAGNASVQTALKLLEDIDLDVLDLEQRADVHRATSQAYAMAGSRRKAADGISRFRDVAARGIPSSKQVVAKLAAHVNRITDS